MKCDVDISKVLYAKVVSGVVAKFQGIGEADGEGMKREFCQGILVFSNSGRRSQLGHKVAAEGECWITLLHICFLCHRVVVRT